MKAFGDRVWDKNNFRGVVVGAVGGWEANGGVDTDQLNFRADTRPFKCFRHYVIFH